LEVTLQVAVNIRLNENSIPRVTEVKYLGVQIWLENAYSGLFWVFREFDPYLKRDIKETQNATSVDEKDVT